MSTATTNLLVAGAIRAELARADRSQADLAEVLGIAQTAISKRLRGATEWKVSELVDVARFLGVDLSVFFADLPEMAGAA